ncbi:MAG: TonB-dependent receptor [Ferruginibacter sp.]
MKIKNFPALFVLPLLLLVSVSASSQNKVSGVITTDNGDILPGATVILKGTSSSSVSNSKGQYSLTADQPFPWMIKVSYAGYLVKDYTITQAGTNNFRLSEANTLQSITLLGTRGKPRTEVNRPVPIDVIPARELQNTGQVELGQQLQFTSPSFNSAKYGINGSLVYANYATLRGLGPDQLLVLVNGKRRHQFSIPHIGFSIARGSVVTDLNAIPFLAVEQTGILRDGASAQYGSDAIAGIVNLGLRNKVNEGIFKTQFGVTDDGDGGTWMSTVNYGFKLGRENSFLNVTFQYQKQGETNRSDTYTGTIYSPTKRADDSIRAARGKYPATAPFKIGVFGNSEIKSPQFFINAGYPLKRNWSLYSFGGYSYKKAIGYGFFRNAIPSNANSNVSLFPDGYVPVFPAEDKDYSTVFGLTRKLLKGWNMDFSTGYGRNSVDRFAENTSNASLGAASPTEFYVGFSSFSQSTTEANFSKNYEALWKMKALNVAFGSQFRLDKYQLERGDSNSYKVGPLATLQGKTPGVQGIAGTSPQDEANETRTNIGLYADVEADITERFLVGLALRYENYSDFSDNFSGKIASRFNLSKNIAVRGSINKGFRAPSLQQVFNSATSTLVQAGQIRYTRQYRSDDPLLDSIGIDNPVPEISWNYNLGLTAKAGKKFLFAIDAYQINVTDKIIISEALVVNNITALRTRLAGSGIQQVSFFTNHVNTRTKGIDLVASYKTGVGKGNIITSLGLTLNETEITKIKNTPDALQAGTNTKIAIIDTINIALIETAQPRQKIILSSTYHIGKFDFVGRATYFGKVSAWEKPSGKPHVKQEFGAKTLLDASLSFSVTKKIQLTAGGNNITNEYPDKVLPTLSAYSSGQTPYNRNVNQFGFSGAFYYGSITVKF